MAAKNGQVQKDTRSSALWGTGGKRGDGSRNSVLWGKGGRNASLMLVITAFVAMVAPWGASAHQTAAKASYDNSGSSSSVFIPSSLLSQAQASPQATFNVIVQGDGSDDAAKVARHVANFAARANNRLVDAANKADVNLQRAQNDAANWSKKASQPRASAKDRQNAATAQSSLAQAQTANAAANGAVGQLADQILKQQVTDQFSSITGVAATLTGAQINNLVRKGPSGLLSITPNAAVQTSGNVKWSSTQLWPYESKSNDNWSRDKDENFTANMPSIAIVDSGIQSRPDFGSRIIASVNLSTLPNVSPGDARGHGTFVAGIAADGLPGITGANPAANLVDVHVLGDNGMGLTSDIIRSCQWILDHKDQYNIKVANFSLHSSITAPFYIDPLDRAVEQLWFNGITVVAAAGNYGTAAGPSGVIYSPGNDPFVITVGAADINGTTDPNKAFVAPWSAWGNTIDGFAKPELSAPGRYMVGPVPTNSTLVSEKPANVTSPGYMQLSGTSFAAPVVAAAAANILARHPDFTPDQVKGALMLSAKGIAKSAGTSGGVGVVQAGGAVGKNNPPNPNAGLEQYLKPGGPSGSQSVGFDAASWNSAAHANASWNSASWNSASWNSASWNSVSWNCASWNDASQEDAAEGDAAADTSAVVIDPADVAALLADPSFDPSTLPDWLIPAAPPTTTATTTTTTSAPATTATSATVPTAVTTLLATTKVP